MKVNILFFLWIPVLCFSQEIKITETDSLYREDQFYMGLTYNLAQTKPIGFAQNGFSAGINFGFMRDMPLNKKRTWAIAAGLGYSYNNLKQNILVEENNSKYNYSIASNFDKNKLVLHYLEVPIEVRWRNSTPESHKFWRVYSGFKLNYLVNSLAKFKSTTEEITVKNNASLNKLVMGPYLAVGYNSINLYAYYALTPIAKNQKIGNEDLNLNAFNIGFQFYIL